MSDILEYIPLFALMIMISVIFICLGLILNLYIIFFISISPLIIFILMFFYYSIFKKKEKERENFYV